MFKNHGEFDLISFDNLTYTYTTRINFTSGYLQLITISILLFICSLKQIGLLKYLITRIDGVANLPTSCHMSEMSVMTF